MTDKTFPDFADITTLTAAYTALIWNGTANKEVALQYVADWAKKRFSYQLSVTVSANDLVVALLTSEGNTPSATEPIFLQIGGTIRTISAATTITLADGTNWMDLGSASHATIEHDLFLYAVWDSNSSVVAIGPARFPYGRLVSDFSATTTNEKHLGNYANYTTTDSVAVIGRFAATLSAGAGYTWTVPTFTSVNLVHHPVYETRILSYTPTWTNLTTGNGSNIGKYQIVGNRCKLFVVFTFGSTSSIAAGPNTATLPIGRSSAYAANPTLVPVRYTDAGAAVYFGLVSLTATAFSLVIENVAGTYPTQTLLSNLIPHTWTTSDLIDFECDYFI